MYKAIPVYNKSCRKWEIQQQRKKHSTYLSRIRSRRKYYQSGGLINLGISPSKKDYLEIARQKEIDRKNRLLYDKILDIYWRGQKNLGSRNHYKAKGARKFEILNIFR